MSQIERPGALTVAARDAELRGRRYEQAVARAEAMRRAEIEAVQDRLIALVGRLYASLLERLKLHARAETPRMLTPFS